MDHDDDESLPDPMNPFAGLPMFGDLARALQGQGPLNWEAAKQFAALATTGNGGLAATANVDPSVRFALAALADVADMHVRDLTGIDRPTPEIAVATPTTWAQQTLDDYRPLFTELATSLNQRPSSEVTDAGDDPMMAMMANLSQMMAPAMLGMAVGSMVGRLAMRAFGQYDLPIPRSGTALVLVPSTIDTFASDWDLSVDEMRMWVLAHQLTQHAVFSQPHVRDVVASLVRQHVGGFRPDPAAVADKLMAADDDADPMKAMQRALGDPEVLLGAVRSPEQAALQPTLDAAIAAVIGYVDYVVDGVGARLIGGDALRVAEAVRRRRVEVAPEDVFVERLLGLQIDAQQVQRGKEFIVGVVDRIGESGLSKLFEHPAALPTPAEIEAPGLWLARLDLGT